MWKLLFIIYVNLFVIFSQGNIPPSLASDIIGNGYPLPKRQPTLSGTCLELTCLSEDIANRTFFSTHPNNCSKLEMDLSNYTSSVNGTLKLRLPLDPDFRGKKMFACSWRFRNKNRRGEECYIVDVGRPPKVPKIKCEAATNEKVSCWIETKRQALVDWTGLPSSFYPVHISFSAKSNWKNSSFHCYDKEECVRGSRTCCFEKGDVRFVSDKPFKRFVLNITVANALGSVSETIDHSIDAILLFDYQISAAYNGETSSVILNWRLVDRYNLSLSFFKNETQISCFSKSDRRKEIKVSNTSTANFTSLVPFSDYTCNHSARITLENGEVGVWSRPKKVQFYSEPARAIDVPAPGVFPGMVRRKNDDCYAWFFNRDDIYQEYCVRFGREKILERYLNFKFPCSGNFQTVIRVAGKTRNNRWGNDTIVRYNSSKICSSAVELKLKKLSDGRYRALAISDQPIQEAFLAVCLCNSFCSSLPDCEQMRRIPLVNKDPLTFEDFEMDSEKERVALVVDFKHCSVMSDWNKSSADDLFSSTYLYVAVMSFLLFVVLLSLIGIKVFWSKLISCYDVIFENHPTQNLNDQFSLQTTTSTGSYYTSVDKNYGYSAAPSVAPEKAQPLCSSQNSANSTAYIANEPQEVIFTGANPYYPQQGVMDDADLGCANMKAPGFKNL